MPVFENALSLHLSVYALRRLSADSDWLPQPGAHYTPQVWFVGSSTPRGISRLTQFISHHVFWAFCACVRVCVCACVCVNGRVCFLVVLFYPLFSCIQYAVHYTVCTVQYNVRKYNNSLPGELHCDKNACSALCTQVCCKFIFLGITRNPNLNLGMVLVIIMSIPKFKLVKLGYF